MVTKMDANQAKAEAKMDANKESMETNLKKDKEDLMKKLDANQAKAETCHKDFLARMDARWNAWREIMNANHNEMLACQETTEVHPQEKEPTSVDTKPEAAEE
jgi:hypothetical protein